jgi:HEAT repeat protein
MISMRMTAVTALMMTMLSVTPAGGVGRAAGREMGGSAADSRIGRALARAVTARDANAWPGARPAGRLDPAPGRGMLPSASWALDDPADSLYRAARAALADGDYKRAAELFRRIGDAFPKSAYAPTALYYEAFALYRSGEGGDLRDALAALRALAATYPASSARGDAATLHTRICGALARQGDASCAARIVQQAESASAPCPSDGDDNDVRIAALNGLLQMDADRALPILRKVLARRDACSAALRRKALFLVSQKGASESADILLSTARQDPDHEIREQAVFWLSQVQDPRVVGLLDSIATHGDDEAVRDKALFALSQQSDHRGLDALRRFAQRDDAPAELREKAVFWLGQAGGPESARFLEDLFAHTTSESLKEKILFGLSQQRAGDWLLGVALDDKQPEEIRKKAVFWASQGGVGVDRFVNLYDRTSDQELREQVIFALSQRSEPAAVDALMHIAKTGKDQELRKKAVFWLGQSSDPRAARFLQELIEQ